jgi:hypothetical protein
LVISADFSSEDAARMMSSPVLLNKVAVPPMTSVSPSTNKSYSPVGLSLVITRLLGLI